MFGTIFARANPDAVAQTWDGVRDQLAAAFPKIGPFMDTAKAEGWRSRGGPLRAVSLHAAQNHGFSMAKSCGRISYQADRWPNMSQLLRRYGPSVGVCADFAAFVDVSFAAAEAVAHLIENGAASTGNLAPMMA